MDGQNKFQVWTYTVRNYIIGLVQHLTQMSIRRFRNNNLEREDLIVESYIYKPRTLELSYGKFGSMIKSYGQYFKEIVFKAQGNKDIDYNINQYFHKIQKYCLNIDTITLTDINTKFIEFEQNSLLLGRITCFNYIINDNATFGDLTLLMHSLTNIRECNFIDVPKGIACQICFSKNSVSKPETNNTVPNFSRKLRTFRTTHETIGVWINAYNHLTLNNFKMQIVEVNMIPIKYYNQYLWEAE